MLHRLQVGPSSSLPRTVTMAESTILVVCDDERTCVRVRAALESLSQNVVLAAPGEAMAAVETHRPTVAVVRTSNGEDAAIIARLRAADPDLQVLLLSDLAA
jgi:ActR/RegA family two-component response regulator